MEFSPSEDVEHHKLWRRWIMRAFIEWNKRVTVRGVTATREHSWQIGCRLWRRFPLVASFVVLSCDWLKLIGNNVQVEPRNSSERPNTTLT